jgi:hypothetical protein
MTQSSILSLSFPVAPMWGTLFSPSRGLFVFSPFLLFLGIRFWPSYWRRHKITPLEVLLAGLSLAWWIGTARWASWWGGGSYGPRLLCELLPCVSILLIPVVANLSLHGAWRVRAVCMAFVIAGVFSVGTHFRGATSAAAQDWNGTPVSIDHAPQRLWSWKDPQFLRGLTDDLRRSHEFKAPAGATPLAFYSIPPCRIFDTRGAPGTFGGPGLIAHKPRLVPIPDGPCEIPRGAAAYSLNLVAMPRGPLGWLNAWAAGDPMPLASVLNAPTGTDTTNAAIVRAGKEGAIVVMATYATDLIIDINGYFASSVQSLP